MEVNGIWLDDGADDFLERMCDKYDMTYSEFFKHLLIENWKIEEPEEWQFGFYDKKCDCGCEQNGQNGLHSSGESELFFNIKVAPTTLTIDITFLLGVPPSKSLTIDVDQVNLVYNGNTVMKLQPMKEGI